jgi:hypothetical protein
VGVGQLATIRMILPSNNVSFLDNLTTNKMPSLLVLIFTVELAVQLINNFGAATVNSLVG